MSVLTFGAHRAYALAPLIGQMNERAVIVRGDVDATMLPEPCLDHGDIVGRRAGEELMFERLDYLKGTDELLHRMSFLGIFGRIQKLIGGFLKQRVVRKKDPNQINGENR